MAARSGFQPLLSTSIDVLCGITVILLALADLFPKHHIKLAMYCRSIALSLLLIVIALFLVTIFMR
jgi:hypothetical protein